MDQGNFVDYKEFELYEVAPEEGSTKARNDPRDPIQRKVITDRGAYSPYKVQARLSACIHGTLDKIDRVPASLIVVDYKLQVTKENARFSSTKTEFIFREHAPSVAEGRAEACPEVTAYAPFTEPIRFNFSEGEQKGAKKAKISGGLDVAGLGKVQVKMGGESENTHTQRYFDQGKAGTHYDEESKRWNRVYWYLEQNQSQNAGVSPTFRIAVLVSRKRDVKFEAEFVVEPRGGIGYAASSAIDKVIHRSTSVDDPIIFDPARLPMGILEGVDRFTLGKLAEDGHLAGLTAVWGLDPISPS